MARLLTFACAPAGDERRATLIGGGTPVAEDETIWGIVRALTNPGLCAFLVFVVTLALFPSLPTLVRRPGHQDDDDGSGELWTELYIPILFVAYNTGDMIGRYLCGFDVLRSLVTVRMLPFCAVVRVVFFPLFLMCNLREPAVSFFGLPVIANDYWPIAVMLLFAISNGFLVTNAMMVGPSLVPPAARGQAGAVMACFIPLGLFVGSTLSFAVLALAEGS